MRATVKIEIEGEPSEIAHTRLRLALAHPALVNVAESFGVCLVAKPEVIEHPEGET